MVRGARPSPLPQDNRQLFFLLQRGRVYADKKRRLKPSLRSYPSLCRLKIPGCGQSGDSLPIQVGALGKQRPC